MYLGFCDGKNNNAECDFDGNDCCTDIEKPYCGSGPDCECKA